MRLDLACFAAAALCATTNAAAFNTTNATAINTTNATAVNTTNAAEDCHCPKGTLPNTPECHCHDDRWYLLTHGKVEPLPETTIPAYQDDDRHINITDQLLFHTPLDLFLQINHDPTFLKRHGLPPMTFDNNNCTWSPDHPKARYFIGGPEVDFALACQRHDFGYRMYAAQCRFDHYNRKRIDRNFKKDLNLLCDRMIATLENQKMKLTDILGCKALAATYYVGVRFGGWVGNPTCAKGEMESIYAYYDKGYKEWKEKKRLKGDAKLREEEWDEWMKKKHERERKEKEEMEEGMKKMLVKAEKERVKADKEGKERVVEMKEGVEKLMEDAEKARKKIEKEAKEEAEDMKKAVEKILEKVEDQQKKAEKKKAEKKEKERQEKEGQPREQGKDEND